MRTFQTSSQSVGCSAQVTNGCFPQPRLQGAPASALRDITFTLVEGDFQVCNLHLLATQAGWAAALHLDPCFRTAVRNVFAALV